MLKKNLSRNNRSLENEVILAVIVLYLLLALVMTVVHYVQPAEQQTVTSSMSPSHNEKNPASLKGRN
ncbi:hypothetical protein [Nitrosovibrio sp. Nv4]|uniref:hypothetical protein n=1 Tax=Nitrosovibrio sp. Nv4 TaxID=1945880 RepID=UPI000BD3ACBA|nr:hypothetical protein [Nitrosovibrio sp. Nv4]SOD40781.1 hypothetical protein SAMN06298226_1063 [Nitrosovibrio sp. Nv4]